MAYPDWLVPLLLGVCAVQLGACTALLCVLLKLYLADREQNKRDHEQNKRDHERFSDAVKVSTAEVKGAIQAAKAGGKSKVRTSMTEVKGVVQTSKVEGKGEVEDLNGAFRDLKADGNASRAEISNVNRLLAGIDGYLRGVRDSGSGSGKSKDVP